MITLTGRPTVITAAEQRRRATLAWWANYVGLLGVTVVIAGLAYLTAPAPVSLATLIFIGLGVIVFARPQWGLWSIAFLGVAGDGEAATWYPFVKGMSSPESILYAGNGLIISPLELILGVTLLGWVWHMAVTRTWVLKKGALFRPVMTFTFFVFVGLVVGVGRGGDSNVALWEVRPLVAFAVIYVLALNLFDKPEHYRRLWTALIAGVVVNAMLTLIYLGSLSSAARDGLDHLGDHQASLHANAFFALLAAIGVTAARSSRRLTLMLIASPVVITVYLLAQRRSAFVGLVVGIVMLCAVLQRTRPRAFWAIVPLLTLVFIGYVGAFWNSQGSAAFPAQAVKTVIAPGQISAADQSSDLYRAIENYNVWFTVRSQPITGLGFGQKYLRPIPNADISFFQWWEYRPHNSVLWIWIQMGAGGFIAMLYLLASTIRHGTLRLLGKPQGYDAAILLTSVVFVVMYAAYAYVDIGWDIESMVFLGVSVACIANSAVPEPAPPPRRVEVVSGALNGGAIITSSVAP